MPGLWFYHDAEDRTKRPLVGWGDTVISVRIHPVWTMLAQRDRTFT